LPTGIFVIVGAQVGGRLIRTVGTTVVVRVGLASYAAGLVYIVSVLSLHLTLWELLPGLALYGTGIGFAGAQLTNVVLSEIPKSASGVASGANTTVRQVGMALGVAIVGALLTAQTASHAISSISSSALPAGTRARAIAGVHALGPNYTPSGAGRVTVQHALESAIVSGTRIALLFAAVLVVLGAVMSFLIPRRVPGELHPLGTTEGFEPLEPLDVDPELLRPARAPAHGAA
jgi:hypothetical protein